MMAPMDTLTILLSLLATARLTRLVVDDKLTEKPMAWVAGKVEGRPLLAYMLGCTWCVSMYAGAAVMGAWLAWGDSRVFTAVAGALAASYVSGFLRESGA